MGEKKFQRRRITSLLQGQRVRLRTNQGGRIFHIKIYSVGKESWGPCRLQDNPVVVKRGRDRAGIVDGTHSSC